MDISGKLIEKFDTQQITDSFQKREFVIEYSDNGRYSDFIKFELIQDKCNLVDDYEINDHLEVHFNLKGRKWKAPDGEIKYFNTLNAWRLNRVSSDNPAIDDTPPPFPSADSIIQPAAATTANGSAWETEDNVDDIDDLPF
jgi:hypothetical protein